MAHQELELGREYHWKDSGEWNIGGTPNCWRVLVTPTGYNGVGGYWVVERWTWRNCGNTHHTQPRTLSLAESLELERDISLRATEAPRHE